MPDRLQRRLAEIGAPADVRALAFELSELAARDPLTGLYNRRFFDEALGQNIETARRYNRDLCLILFDLDGFKQVNDTCGHPAGDEALKTFAHLLMQTVRASDKVFRIGGDEFAVILPETGISEGRNFAARFFNQLEGLNISASAGASARPAENLFAAADAELLAAKRAKQLPFERVHFPE